MVIKCSCGKVINANELEKVSLSFIAGKLFVFFDCKCKSTLAREAKDFEAMLKDQDVECFIIRDCIVEK